MKMGEGVIGMADEKKPADAKKGAEAAAPEEAAPEGKKKPPLIAIIAVLVLVGVALAGGISYFVVTKAMQNNSSDDGGNVNRYHDPGVFVKLGDAKEGLLVNVGGVKAGRFLKVGIVMEMNPSKKNIIVEGKIDPVAETKMLDTVLRILRSEPLEGFDATKQEALKEKIKTEVNHELSEGSVYNVYITSFVLQ